MAQRILFSSPFDFNTAKKKAEELLNNAEISEKAIKMVAESRYINDKREEKALDENMDFNQLPSFLDNEEEEQDEVLDLTSKSGRSL